MADGVRLDDLIARLAYRAAPIQAAHYATWPNLAANVALTPGSATPGAWVELIPAAGGPAAPFTVMVVEMDVATVAVTFEVGIGGAGSEVSVGNVTLGGLGSMIGSPVPMPIIASGTRVALRGTTYSGGGGSLINVKMVSILLPQRMDPHNTLARTLKLSPTQPPALSGLSTPVVSAVASAAGVWTYGAYAEQYAGTVETAITILTGFTWRSDAANGDRGQIAVSYGAAASEVDFLTVPYAMTGANGMLFRIDLPVPLILPGSTRLAARHATDQAGARNAYFPMFTVIKSAVMP